MKFFDKILGVSQYQATVTAILFETRKIAKEVTGNLCDSIQKDDGNAIYDFVDKKRYITECSALFPVLFSVSHSRLQNPIMDKRLSMALTGAFIKGAADALFPLEISQEEIESVTSESMKLIVSKSVDQAKTGEKYDISNSGDLEDLFRVLGEKAVITSAKGDEFSKSTLDYGREFIAALAKNIVQDFDQFNLGMNSHFRKSFGKFKGSEKKAFEILSSKLDQLIS